MPGLTDPDRFTQILSSNIPSVTDLNLTPKSACGCGGHDDALPDDAAAVAWVKELRDRYRSYLPSPAEFLTSQDTNPRD